MDIEYIKKISGEIVEELYGAFAAPVSNAMIKALIKGYEIGFSDCIKTFNLDSNNFEVNEELLDSLITKNENLKKSKPSKKTTSPKKTNSKNKSTKVSK